MNGAGVLEVLVDDEWVPVVASHVDLQLAEPPGAAQDASPVDTEFTVALTMTTRDGRRLIRDLRRAARPARRVPPREATWPQPAAFRHRGRR